MQNAHWERDRWATGFAASERRYGLAAGGEEGAARSLAIFREEIERSLALTGCRSPSELTRDHIVLPG